MFDELDEIFEEFEEQSSGSAVSGELITVETRPEFGAVGVFEAQGAKQPYVSPSLRYINSLSSDRSKTTMDYALNRVSKMMNGQDHVNFPWEKLNVDVVQYIKDKLVKDSLRPTTINTYLTAIKQVCKNAWLDKLMDHDTYLRISNVSGVKGKRVSKGRSLQAEEIKKLLTTCSDKSKPTNIRDAAIIVIMRSCGLRREEVVTLKKSSINSSNREINILGKGNKERKLRIPKGAYPIIERWINFKSSYKWRNNEPEYLFVPIHKTGALLSRKLSGQAIHDLLQARTKAADIAKFSPHDIRRTFATEMLKNEVEITDVQKMMGHSDVSTTQIYDKRDDERILDIMDDMFVSF